MKRNTTDEFDVAEDYLNQSLDKKMARGDLFGQGISHEKLGKLWELQGNFEKVITHQHMSIDIKELVEGDRRGFVLSLCLLARAYAATGQIEQSQIALNRVRQDFLPKLVNDFEMLGEYHRTKGLVYQIIANNSNNSDEIATYKLHSLSHLEQARQIWQGSNSPCRQAEMDNAISELRLRHFSPAQQFCGFCGYAIDHVSRITTHEYNNCSKEISSKLRLHFECKHCGKSTFVNPKLGVGVIVVSHANEPAITLVRRKYNPFLEWWSLIAGYVEYDESPEQTALRETMEEAGLSVKLRPELLGIYTFRDDPRADMNHIVYIAESGDGHPIAGSDASEVKMFTIAELLSNEKIAFEGNRQPIVDWIKMDWNLRRKPLISDKDQVIKEEETLNKNIWSFLLRYDL